MGIAKIYLVDDIPAANRPDSRLGKIVHKIDKGYALTVLEQDFLRGNGHASLIGYSLGELDREAFLAAAQAERNRRPSVAARPDGRKLEEDARFTLASERRNAEIFAESERNRQRRKIFVRFGMPWIDPCDLGRVRHILRSVATGTPVTDTDVEWLYSEGHWTDELRRAHHAILAGRCADGWSRTKDAWQAVEACSNWRKADEPEKAIAIVREALALEQPPRVHSALLTTGGGALRDMCSFEEARGQGLTAHALAPDDFRPCTLLGAVCLQTGAYAEGIEWYARAEAKGASQIPIDREIRSILAAVRPAERARIRKALMLCDEDRFRRF